MNGNLNQSAGEATGEISREDLFKSIVDSGLAADDSVNPNDGDHAPSPEAKTAEAVKAEVPAAKPEAKAEDAATTKDREAKAQERANKSWEEVNAEKAKLAQERAALDAEKAKAKQPGHSPEDYEAIAQDFENEGKDDLAKAARNKAQTLRQEAEQAKANTARAEFDQKRLAVIKETVGQNPDLNNPETELFKAVEKLLKDRPVLLRYEEGFAHAVEAVKQNLKASRVEAMQKEVAELKQKLGDYEAKLQPGVGSPSSATRSVTFESLPLTEQRSRLIQALGTADAGE